MPGAQLRLVAAFHPRHYSAAYLAVFAVVLAIGYGMILWRKRRSEQASERPYRPSQGSNELERHPSPRGRPPSESGRAPGPETTGGDRPPPDPLA